MLDELKASLEERVEAIEQALRKSPNTQATNKIRTLELQLNKASGSKKTAISIEIIGLSVPSLIEKVLSWALILGILAYAYFIAQLADQNWVLFLKASSQISNISNIELTTAIPIFKNALMGTQDVIKYASITAFLGAQTLLILILAWLVYEIDPIRRLRQLFGVMGRVFGLFVR